MRFRKQRRTYLNHDRSVAFNIAYVCRRTEVLEWPEPVPRKRELAIWQRTNGYSRSDLSAERIARLEVLDGWTWEGTHFLETFNSRQCVARSCPCR